MFIDRQYYTVEQLMKRWWNWLAIIRNTILCLFFEAKWLIQNLNFVQYINHCLCRCTNVLYTKYIITVYRHSKETETELFYESFIWLLTFVHQNTAAVKNPSGLQACLAPDLKSSYLSNNIALKTNSQKQADKKWKSRGVLTPNSF